MDIQVSYMRILIGDNDRVAPTYSDAEIRANVRLNPPRTAQPIALHLAGAITATQYPSDVSGGPFTGPF